MPLWSYFGGWLADVLALSFALALFEISLEKDQGWASGLSREGLGKPLLQGSPLARLFEKPYITVYHLLMFGVIVPLILAGQCWIIRACWVSRTGAIRDLGLLTVWQVGPVNFVPLLSSIAAWLAISTTEDFLWFALNWHYPTSRQDLLAGNIWWHTRWIAIGKIKLPRCYISALILAGFFFWVSSR
jgi:hypothetical protein